MNVIVYSFENEAHDTVSDFTTQDYEEACQLAQQLHCLLVANTYELIDSEVVADYCDSTDAAG